MSFKSTEEGGISLRRESLLQSSARLPDHVVYRGFVAETVVLNLQTGKYHGLNPVGGRMLEALQAAPSVREAVEVIAAEYGQDEAVVEDDVLSFCRDLLERGLVEVDSDEP